MKHVHAELIKELADDTSLIKLVKLNSSDGWAVSLLTGIELFAFDERREYYLTTPAMQEVTLAFLNKNPIQYKVDSKWEHYLGGGRPDPALEWRVTPAQKWEKVDRIPFRVLVENFDKGVAYYSLGEKLVGYVELAQAFDKAQVQILVDV